MHWIDKTRDYLAGDNKPNEPPQKKGFWGLWIPITGIIALLILLFGGYCTGAELGFWTFDTLGSPVLVSIDTIYVSMGDSTAAGRDTTITSYSVRGYEYIAETNASWDTACVSYRAVTDTPLVGFISIGSWCPPSEVTILTPFILSLSDDEYTAFTDAASNKNIIIYKEDSYKATFTVLDADRDTVDISGATAIFTARRHASDTAKVIIDTLNITVPTSGKMELSLSSDETDITPLHYPADVQIVFPSGDVKTVWRADLVVRWDVSR